MSEAHEVFRVRLGYGFATRFLFMQTANQYQTSNHQVGDINKRRFRDVRAFKKTSSGYSHVSLTQGCIFDV